MRIKNSRALQGQKATFSFLSLTSNFKNLVIWQIIKEKVFSVCITFQRHLILSILQLTLITSLFIIWLSDHWKRSQRNVKLLDSFWSNRISSAYAQSSVFQFSFHFTCMEIFQWKMKTQQVGNVLDIIENIL